MNWIKIKKDCPKAFELFIKFMKYYENCTGNKTDPSPILYIRMQLILGNERILYDFFDKQKIFINTENIGSDDKPHFRSAIKYTINGIRHVWTNPKGVKTRKEAETPAYKKAFNLLEKQ